MYFIKEELFLFLFKKSIQISWVWANAENRAAKFIIDQKICMGLKEVGTERLEADYQHAFSFICFWKQIISLRNNLILKWVLKYKLLVWKDW